jgi:two-component system, NtrC family, response regulator AtoC
MRKFKIFVVEDDLWYSRILEYYLSLNPDYEVMTMNTAKDCFANLSKKPDLITLDYSLKDGKGTEVLKKIKQMDSEIPVIVISGQEDISTAISMLKAGASDYFVKDDNIKDLLLNAITRIREHRDLKNEVEQLREELVDNYEIRNSIKGNSAPLQKIFQMVQKAAQTNINVSVTGETGTGKELVAKAIHYNSDRRKKPFVAINMAAIPKELMESELFGYEKGAFTGAVSRKPGKFEEANKGTIFLDEIGELDLNMQSKLLRVIQEREVVRIGGKDKVDLDVRIIIATHKNLEDEVRKGNMREDFYYRITGLPIALPPLRERGDDILVLAKFFLDNFVKANKLKPIKLSNDAKQKLLGYNYPGNIRELKSVIELAAVMCNGAELVGDDIVFKNVSAGGKQFLTGEKTLREYNIEIVTHYLKKYDNNIMKIAEVLDIGKTTIYKMIKDYDIEL